MITVWFRMSHHRNVTPTGPSGFPAVGTVLAVTTLIVPLTAEASPPVSPADEVLAAKLLETAGEGFRIRQTEHFTICYDTPPEVLWPLGVRGGPTRQPSFRIGKRDGRHLCQGGRHTRSDPS